MSSPYLKSGESLILTTDRVSINSLQYEVLLTTRYLILVDVRYGQFLPQKIPLSTILTVKGGKIATGEPVITLSFSDSGSIENSGPMALIFLQQPGEQRKSERDEWLKNLMGLVVSVRQETSTTSLPASTEDAGIRPSVRRPVAPDKLPPRTTVIDSRPAPVELTVIPDEPESLIGSVEELGLPGMTILEEETKSKGAPINLTCEDSPPGSGKETGLKDAIPSPEVKEIIDTPPEQKKEAELPDTAPGAVPAGQLVQSEPGTNLPAQKPSTFSFMGAVKSLFSPKVTKELQETGTTSIHDNEETGAVQPGEPTPPESISNSETEEIVEFLFVPEEKGEFPDMVPSGISAAGEFSGTTEADTPGQKSFALALQTAVKSLITSREMRESSDTDTTSALLFEETESAPQEKPGSPDIPVSPEPEGTKPILVSYQDSELSEATIRDSGKSAELDQRPAGEATPQIPKSPLPSGGTGLPRHSVIAALAVILLILGIVGGAVFYPQYFTKPEKEPVPPQTIPLPQISLLETPVTTTVQQTPEPTTVQQTTIQQTPVPTPVVIPQEGVWVRVEYPGNYYGWVGNPGSLQGVTGNGDQVYKVRDENGTVQVRIYTEDNSGNMLTVEIYKNGSLIEHRTRSIPMSSIEILIDAKTGKPPGALSVVPNETNQTGSGDGRVMYF